MNLQQRTSGMDVNEIRGHLDSMECVRHHSWPIGHYAYKAKSGEYIRHCNHYTEGFPIGYFEEGVVYDIRMYKPALCNTDRCKDNINAIEKRLTNGEHLARPQWTDAYLYNKAGQTYIHWKQSNGNIYNEPYNFGPFEDGIFVTVNYDK